MSEAINAENIEQILRQRLYDLSATVDTQEVSHVAEVGDGIAHIFGLKSAMAGELLEFTSSITGKTVYGLAQNLDREEVGAVLFGDVDSIKEGDACRTTAERLAYSCGKIHSIRRKRASTPRYVTYHIRMVPRIPAPSGFFNGNTSFNGI